MSLQQRISFIVKYLDVITTSLSVVCAIGHIIFDHVTFLVCRIPMADPGPYQKLRCTHQAGACCLILLSQRNALIVVLRSFICNVSRAGTQPLFLMVPPSSDNLTLTVLLKFCVIVKYLQCSLLSLCFLFSFAVTVPCNLLCDLAFTLPYNVVHPMFHTCIFGQGLVIGGYL